MDEVVLVLRTVELTAEVIESVRARLAAEGIALDESIPPVDDELDGIEPTPRRRVAAAVGRGRAARGPRRGVTPLGDFEEDGPELGGVRPARSAAARRRVPARGVVTATAAAAARPTRSACTSRRSAGCRSSPGPRRSSTRGASSPAASPPPGSPTWPPPASSPPSSSRSAGRCSAPCAAARTPARC